MICEITSKKAVEFLMPRHYSGRKPSISKAFGWYVGGELEAVATFGKPASPYVCKGFCGDKWSAHVYELNRLCRTEDFNLPLSHFVACCLKMLKPLDWIVVSYSDTAMHHTGYIYQACNFIYTGMTKERTDIYSGKHSRHYTQDDRDRGVRVLRSAKHRYVYFCSNSKSLKKQWLNDLRYKPQPYPKGDNKNYTLGEYLKPILIDAKTKEIISEKEI